MLEYKNKDISGRSNPNKQRFYMYVFDLFCLFHYMNGGFFAAG